MESSYEDLDDEYRSTTVGIPPEVQVETIEILNQSLAKTIDLWMQIKCAYWNVRGMNFLVLRQLFSDIESQLYNFIDVLGERVVTIGGRTQGSIQAVFAKSKMPEYPNRRCTDKELITLLSRHIAIYSIHLRHSIEVVEGLGEAGSVDIYREISLKTETFLRNLEAHLQTDAETS